MYVTILVFVIALLGGAVGFVAAWIIQGRALQKLRQDSEEELMVWRETCEEIEQEGEGFREHAESLERRLGAAHTDGTERIVALEIEVASIKQAKADLLAAVEADVAAAKLSYETRIAGLEADLARATGRPVARSARPDESPAHDDDPQGQRPDSLGAPFGSADDLKKINGVGPKLEQTLNELGIFHYRQIAGLTRENVAWIDNYLKFKGRIERDNWIGQASALSGEMAEATVSYREESEADGEPKDLSPRT